MLSRRDVLHGLVAASAWPVLVDTDALTQAGGVAPRAGAVRTFAGMSCRWCPPGTFLMGSPRDEPHHRDDETQVTVRLTRGFWMAAHEATQGQWHAVAGEWPPQPPTAQFGLGDDVPVY